MTALKEGPQSELMRIHLAWKKGPKNPESISKTTGIKYKKVVRYLFWHKIADRDPCIARQLIAGHAALVKGLREAA